MKKQNFLPIIILFLLIVPLFNTSSNLRSPQNKPPKGDPLPLENPVKFSHVIGNFSNYNLSLYMDEVNSKVEGNLTVDFYNNDPVNLTMIPFHLYLSGMLYDTRKGNIEIQNVFDFDNSSNSLPYEVYSELQIMWVNLTEELGYQERVKFIIQFESTLPDGPYDRANSYGSDLDQSRIFKFTGFYPIPCVYDNKDAWNTDPYLSIGDPFYFDMAYYKITMEVPSDMIVAATGQLTGKINKGATKILEFDPILPVREVTFSASRYFQVESKIVNGVNISTYYLPRLDTIWENNALNYLKNALLLYNNTFGAYDYPTLNVVEEYTSFGGMEYPCQVYASEAIDGYSYLTYVKEQILEKTIAHEACHQWWYNLVGNDEVDYPFLDEGLVCWSTDYYGEHYYNNWEYFQFTRYIDKVRTYCADTGLSSRINLSSYEYLSYDNWVYTCYYKAPLILEKLRQLIGSTNFLTALKQYYESYKFTQATLFDLQETFESVIGSSLDWFFLPWFNNLYLPRYSFKNHSFNSDTNELTFTIEDLNEKFNQFAYYQEIPFSIYGANNHVIITPMIPQYLVINGTTTFNFTLPETPYRIDLHYINYVLVQLDAASDSKLSLNLEKPFIPGYYLGISLIVTMLTIGIVIFLRKKTIL
jgi:hypothetical protein